MPYNLVNSALLKVMSTLFITTNYLSNPKDMPASAKKVYFQFAECSYILCKDIAKERKESLLSICRVQLYLMQRYCKFEKRKVFLYFKWPVHYTNDCTLRLKFKAYNKYLNIKIKKVYRTSPKINVPTITCWDKKDWLSHDNQSSNLNNLIPWKTRCKVIE